MNDHIPIDVWRCILSYNSVPYCRSVCTELNQVENALRVERVQNLRSKYGGFISVAAFCSDWDSILFMLNQGNTFNMDDMKEVMERASYAGRFDVTSLLLEHKQYNVHILYPTLYNAILDNRNDIIVWIRDSTDISPDNMQHIVEAAIEEKRGQSHRCTVM